MFGRKSIEKKYDIKGDIENVKDGLKFLGRRIERQGGGFVWSADPKHHEILSDEWRLVNTNPVSTPVATEHESRLGYQGASSGDGEGRCHEVPTGSRETQLLGALPTRCMARPREGDEKPLKRVLRFLQGEPRVGIVFRWQPLPSQLVVLTDSDWAGCKVTRRSTTGIVVNLREPLLLFQQQTAEERRTVVW